MLAHIYRCIWLTLQFLIDILELINWMFVLVRTVLIRSYDRSHGGLEKFEYQTLEECQALLSKKPKHIAVIVGPAATHVNLTLFKRLLNYAIQMDISCISIYDTRSVENKDRFQLENISMPKLMQREMINERHCLWTLKHVYPANGKSNSHINTNTNGKPQANGYLVPHRHKNEGKSLEIFQFTTQDNISSISEVCRDLFNKRHTTEIQHQLRDRMQFTQCIDKALAERLFDRMSTNINIEPEICIVFNAFLCTFGMLPWHTRFTEFFNLRSGAEFDANVFADILYRYSRCEQRWGK